MPSYNLKLDSGESYSLNSETEMDESQLSEAAQQLVGGQSTSSVPAHGTPPSSAQPAPSQPAGPTTGQPPAPMNEDAGFAERYGRRLHEAGQAILDVPSQAGQLITGSGTGRISAILNLLKGTFGAAVSPLTAIPEAATEQAAKGLGFEEGTARTMGDVGGIVSTLGLGMAAKAGALGELGITAAKALGVGALPGVAEEFRGLSPVDVQLMKIAHDRESGPLSDAAFQRKSDTWLKWMNWAKETGVADDPPTAPNWDAAPQVQFQNRDLNLMNAFGTPLTQMARKDPTALQTMADIQLTEFNTTKAIAQRNIADTQGLSATPTKEVQQALFKLMTDKIIDESTLSAPELETVKYVRNKFAADRSLIIDKLRTDLTAKGYSPDEIMDKIPDNWGIDQYLPHIFPGEYFIKDSAGRIMNGEPLSTKFEAKLAIRELAQKGIDPDNLTVTSRSFFDGDLLKGLNRNRISVLNDIGRASGLTRDEINAAADGEFGVGGKQKWFGNLFKRGGSPNFSNDLQYVMQVYNRGIERWSQLTDLSNRVAPAIKEMEARNYPVIAKELSANMKALWGYRNELSQRFDAQLQAIPGVRDLVAPYALERWGGALKSGLVDVLLKYSPRFQAVNSTQVATTLWPVAGANEIYEGSQLLNSKLGGEILDRFEPNIAAKLGELGKGRLGKITGATESFNQRLAFLTMYNRAAKLGLSPEAAADYAILRGNIYSQFMSLSSDRPRAFRAIDPSGMMGTMFQRFNVKQLEQMIDLVKDKNISGASKWLSTIALFGGARALTFGGLIGGGWLTHRIYKDIEEKYGSTVANVIHVGLPALAGVDLSNTAMVYNPPMGSSIAEKMGNQALGPFWSIGSSVIGAALQSNAPDPSAASRVLNSIVSRIPVAKELDSLRRIIMDDYDISTVDGKLRYKADTKDLFVNALGFRNLDDTRLTLLSDALVDAKSQRNEVLNYVASRYGQSFASGVTLPKEMLDVVRSQVDGWNTRWPEFPITQTDILNRARARQVQLSQTLAQRLQKQTPRALRQSPEFSGEFER